MNMWKPVQIENVPFDALEGLVGIEECTNYDLNNISEPKPNITTSKRKGIGKIKTSKRSKKTKTERVQMLSPSKQGYTEDKYVTSSQITSCINHRNEVDTNLLKNIQLGDTFSSERVIAWSNLPLQDSLLKALSHLNFTEPTQIQLLTLPAAILGKRDILGAAETGSGKTIAFGLPMLHGILKLKDNLAEQSDKEDCNESNLALNKSAMDHQNYIEDVDLVRACDDIEIPESTSKGPLYGLILTPTRELAIQIKNHLSSLAQFTDITIAVVIGGMAVEKQLRILKKAPDIVVATPGRLWELIEDGNPHLSQVSSIKFLAIDETDRMLERGHFRELKEILERINISDANIQKRQNFVFSATLTLVHELPRYLVTKKKIKVNSKISDMTSAQKLQKIVELLNITNPKVVDISQGKGTSETLTECRITCSINEKDYYVYYFLMKHPGRTLIFCNSIGCVRRLVTILSLLNCKPLALHSALQQRQRLKNLDRFRENENSLLIATDVAARGLDIQCIQHVMHYQTPRTSESYVHRSGRTARASKEGITVLLVEPGELQQYLRLCRTLGKTEDIPLFPIQDNLLNAVKERVNVARELDKMELKVRKSNSDAGWIQKAAEEMDILVDDELSRYDKSESQSLKKVANIRRKELSSLLQKPLFPKQMSMKYPLSSGQLNIPFVQGHQESDDAITVMKNAIETNTVRPSIKAKHLFKSRIRKTGENVNLKLYLQNRGKKRNKKN